MTTVRRYLLGTLGAHLVLIVFFAAFKFEVVTIALYSGIWVGIGLSMLLFWRASIGRRVKLVVGIFIFQILVFAGLDFARMNDLFLEEVGFLSIGVWGGILIGTLLNATKTLESRVSSLEQQLESLKAAAERE
jgi:hypothetical protein